MKVLALIGLLLLAACQSDRAAESVAELKVVSVQSPELGASAIGQARRGFDQLCDAWQLSALDVERFFALAQPVSQTSAQQLDLLPCRVRGELLAEGEDWRYTINLSGVASWRGVGQVRYFVCSEAACASLLSVD